ncbi:MAG TPA: O-antigen ligase family protein [Terracidiphilus sp.]|nr:O-antigen ligase family protein [Terracidiphilus sp.]
MRTAARALLLLFVFAIPWEYSLDFGAPWGNVARLAGLALLAVAIPAILQAGRVRALGTLQWASILLFAYLGATYLWSIEPEVTLGRLPGYLQELMIVWLVGELIDSKDDLHNLFRAWLAGCAVLAGLTLSSAVLALRGAEQVRFFAAGQDPNDTARFLALGLPIAALLADRSVMQWKRRISLLYIPLGVIAILATASRGGFLTMLVSLVGCGVLMARTRRFRVLHMLVPLLAIVAAALFMIPRNSLLRIASIAEQANGGDLNQRVNIWQEGWNAFQRAPLLGHGAGTFVAASGLSSIDTAHNTALSVLVEGGILGLAIGAGIFVCSIAMARSLKGALQIALLAMLAAWTVASLVGTTGESRTTWLLFAVIATAARQHRSSALVNVKPQTSASLQSAGAGA